MEQVLSDAELIFASALNVPLAMQRVARALVPSAADFCFIFLATGDEVRCVATAHATLQGQRLLRDLTRVYKITRRDPVSTVAHVLRTGHATLRPEIHSEVKAPRTDLRVFTLHQRLGARSALVVPIGNAPKVIGAISLSYAESGRAYDADDLRPAGRLAALAAAFLKKRIRTKPTQSHVPFLQRRLPRLRARI